MKEFEELKELCYKVDSDDHMTCVVFEEEVGNCIRALEYQLNPFKELYSALGWQGGTIHQIKEVLRVAKLVANTHDEALRTEDWEKFKATLETLKKVI